jgi:type 2 lantibiotic biosynthesis protein LanM
MIQEAVEPAWYEAITLEERVALLKGTQSGRVGLPTDAELGKRRADSWRRQPPFTSESILSQRLASIGLSEEELSRYLGTSIEDVQACFDRFPAWLEEIVQAFGGPDSVKGTLISGDTQGAEHANFLNAFAPLIRRARERVHAGLGALAEERASAPFELSIIEPLLFASVPARLLMMSIRTLVLELHVARLEGMLDGDTPEERFRSFFQRLERSGVMLSLLREYPVLARQMVLCLDQWADASLEFVRRLCVDWEAIGTTFGAGGNQDQLVGLIGSKGDGHRRGRSVLIVKFSSGLQLVYKPRPVAVDVRFQELLSWLNSRGAHPPFRTMRVLDRGSHGWVEFIVAESCTSEPKVQRFYERFGSYLALLYALEATDFHFENLIAAGEHPVLVDLEALFQTRLEESRNPQGHELGAAALGNSILRSGLMPQRVWANEASEGIDLSGLGTPAGQLTPHGVPHWEQGSTDEMRLTRRRVPMEGAHNRPMLNGAEVEPLDYTEAIITGFNGIYDQLMKLRGELLADDGPLSLFADAEVRIILRSTRSYGVLLYESFHPDVLRDALERDRLFDHLWAGVERSPSLAKAIPSEIEDLQHGDIPIFTTYPGSLDLWTSGRHRLTGFFAESGMALVRHRIQALDECDRARQCWMIRASLATLARVSSAPPGFAYPASQPATTPDRERLMAASAAIAEKLEAEALRSQQEVAWLGLSFKDERHCSLLPLGADLYDGLPGVALYLGYLGAITGQERYTALARGALLSLRRFLSQPAPSITPIGAFDGLGGVIYTLAHLGVLWNDFSMLEEAERLVAMLPRLIQGDTLFDVIGGAAGCILSLACLYKCAPIQQVLSAAAQCGDHLLSNALRIADSAAWPSKAGSKPLTGFSHGAAGIGWALLKLAGLTGAERFRDCAFAALRYERSLFSSQEGNWPDLRDSMKPVSGDGPGFGVMWCHGAPGIALGRALCLGYADGAEIRSEITSAVRTTIARGFVGNHSLCHGDLGNLECLLVADAALNRPDWRAEAEHRAAIILKSIERNGGVCGNLSRVDSPGLMTGLAGIGYELLRLAEPERVPSVLALAPPCD